MIIPTHGHNSGQEVRERPRRILQIFSRYKEYGGEEGSVYRIGDALQSEFDVGFFIYSSTDLFSSNVLRKTVGALKAVSNWEVISNLRRYHQLGRYDCWLVHNVFPAMSPSVYAIAFKLGVPIVQYLHNYRLGCINGFFMNHGEPCQRCIDGKFFSAFQTACWHDSRIQSGVMGGIMKRVKRLDVFDKVQHWIAISDAQKKEHVRMGIPAERITTIHHFLDVRKEPPPYPPAGDVLFVGRLSNEKGVEWLLRAWVSLQNMGRILWIVGDGPEREKLEALAETLALRNVRFTGFLKSAEAESIWANTACSVVPSIWMEPFGMVVLESWAKCRPVVAHRIGALPEIIEDGKGGILVEPSAPSEMAAAIRGILEHPEQGAVMGRAGFARLSSHFSQAIWQNKIQKVFQEVTFNDPYKSLQEGDSGV